MDHKTPFPVKLYHILEESEAYGHILRWTKDQRAFVILQPVLFESDVMPRYFVMTKYCSFTRKLNKYGFKRFAMPERQRENAGSEKKDTSTPTKSHPMTSIVQEDLPGCVYAHETFYRGNLSKIYLMRNTQLSSKKKKTISETLLNSKTSDAGAGRSSVGTYHSSINSCGRTCNTSVANSSVSMGAATASSCGAMSGWNYRRNMHMNSATSQYQNHVNMQNPLMFSSSSSVSLNSNPQRYSYPQQQTRKVMDLNSHSLQQQHHQPQQRVVYVNSTPSITTAATAPNPPIRVMTGVPVSNYVASSSRNTSNSNAHSNSNQDHHHKYQQTQQQYSVISVPDNIREQQRLHTSSNVVYQQVVVPHSSSSSSRVSKSSYQGDVIMSHEVGEKYHQQQPQQQQVIYHAAPQVQQQVQNPTKIVYLPTSNQSQSSYTVADTGTTYVDNTNTNGNINYRGNGSYNHNNDKREMVVYTNASTGSNQSSNSANQHDSCESVTVLPNQSSTIQASRGIAIHHKKHGENRVQIMQQPTNSSSQIVYRATNTNNQVHQTQNHIAHANKAIHLPQHNQNPRTQVIQLVNVSPGQKILIPQNQHGIVQVIVHQQTHQHRHSNNLTNSN